MKIGINTDTCIRCGNCVSVCPAGVFRQAEKKAPIEVVRPEACFECSHCVDVCPTGSVDHESFPKEIQHEIDYSAMPTPEQMLNLIHSRRSNRTFTNKIIPDEQMQNIVEAAYYAPTAGNNRMVKVNVINDPKQLDAIVRFTIETLVDNLDKLGQRYVPIVRSARQAYEKGLDVILHYAPQIIVFSSDHKFGPADCNLAYANASLMAQSYGISQVYLGFAYTAAQLGDPQKVQEVYGVKQKIHALMALGIPRLRYKRYAERA